MLDSSAAMERRVAELEARLARYEIVQNGHRLAAPPPALAQYLDCLPVGVYFCEAPSGVIRWFNQRAVELWGRQPKLDDPSERFCGSQRLYQIDGTPLPHFDTPAADIMRGGPAVSDREVIIERPNGSRINVTVNLDPIRDSEGRLIGLINVFQDVTDRRTAKRQLEDSENRLRLALDAGRMGTWEWDVAADRLQWSPELVRAAGLQPASVPGCSAELWRLIHGEDVERVRDMMSAASRRGEHLDLEFRIATSVGERWLSWRGRVERGASGTPMRMIGVGFDVTQTKKVEADLRAAEARIRRREEQIRLITDALPVLVGYIDTDWRYRFCNKAHEAWFGPSPTGHAGSHPRDVLGDAAFAAVEPRMRLAFAGEAQKFETVALGRAVSVNYMPDVDEHGHIRGMAVLVEDVTEYKRAVEAAQRNEATLEATFQLAAVGMAPAAITDGRFLRPNRKFCEITGYSEEELSRLTFRDITHPDDAAEAAELFRSLVAGRCSQYEMEKRYIRKDGRAIWVHGHVSLVRDTEGRPLHTVAIIQEVTQRREAEQTMREIENRQRLAVESANIGLWDWELATGRLTASEKLHQILGVPPGGISSTFDSLRSLAVAEDLPKLETALRQGLHGEPYSVEFRIQRPDGQVRWLVTSGRALVNEAGHPARILGATLDITERKESQVALEAANAALRRANADLEQFAWAAAHDLQEPLRNMTLFSELLARKHFSALDDQGRSFLGFIMDGAQRMQSLVHDLLVYTKVVAPSDTPIRPVVAGEVVRKVLGDLHSAIAEADADVEVGPIPDLRVFETQFGQMLQNLIGNAIKYRRQGVRPVVRVWAEKEGRHCVVHVADNGVGIAPEYHERIFGMFRRLHGRDVPGTGIGLAVCKRIVEHYDCRIWLDSEPDAGSTFHFTLPLA